VKAATTLDVLSGGRGWLGIGAAWNAEESAALGFPFPPLGERFEMLEDTLRMAHEMWQGERGSQAELHGRHVHATRLLNAPQAVTRPRPPIMIGGGGERRTLRLVAAYGDATNVFGGPGQVAHKYEVLRAHCEAIGRPYDEIERSTLQTVRFGDGTNNTETPAQLVDRFGELADAGVQHLILSVRGVDDTSRLERLAADVFPSLRAL
jgi:alkanesulfonate monooxygenase SsuD/methylene tetrahydromethanopterin reductase-like flavin-dependent oxidoreductase (luciferase family)